eukprot:31138-Pelagococcus_subviridis.AAC.13
MHGATEGNDESRHRESDASARGNGRRRRRAAEDRDRRASRSRRAKGAHLADVIDVRALAVLPRASSTASSPARRVRVRGDVVRGRCRLLLRVGGRALPRRRLGRERDLRDALALPEALSAPSRGDPRRRVPSQRHRDRGRRRAEPSVAQTLARSRKSNQAPPLTKRLRRDDEQSVTHNSSRRDGASSLARAASFRPPTAPNLNPSR